MPGTKGAAAEGEARETAPGQTDNIRLTATFVERYGLIVFSRVGLRPKRGSQSMHGVYWLNFLPSEVHFHEEAYRVPRRRHGADHPPERKGRGLRGFWKADRLADRSGHQRPGHRRHHRRGRDADLPGARGVHPLRGGARGGPRAHHRGLRLQRHQSRHHAFEVLLPGRRGRAAGGDALLQQGHPEGPDRQLLRRGRRSGQAHHPL